VSTMGGKLRFIGAAGRLLPGAALTRRNGQGVLLSDL